MGKLSLTLLSIGIFVIIIAICLTALVFQFINIDEIIPVILTFYGVWMVVAAGIRAKNPEKYVRGAFSIFAWGILFMAIGGSWYLYALNPDKNLMLSVTLFVGVFGMLIMAAALRSWRR
ncbi:MAG: hypothetical protein JSV85_04955 [Candidatus Bathyarchaeota archaeon]|nr:MAG: hypothetical protein JSV85_04955 [Candidatus Bathyarchaeota archaeon]